jgi:acetoin utilization deacetylase AcuC-like enzyme
MWKPRGSLDVGLPDGTDDTTFLDALQRLLPTVVASRPEVIFYLAGADPYRDDQLGGLNLTMEGLRRRDRMVLEAAVTARVPVASRSRASLALELSRRRRALRCLLTRHR